MNAKEQLVDWMKKLNGKPKVVRTVAKIGAVVGALSVMVAVNIGSEFLCLQGLMTYGVSSFLLGLLNPA
jgi:hypothetical protein